MVYCDVVVTNLMTIGRTGNPETGRTAGCSQGGIS